MAAKHGRKRGKPVTFTAEQWAGIIDKVMAGPPGTITHVAPDDDGAPQIVPDPDLASPLIQ
jgi:hypothetical protein